MRFLLKCEEAEFGRPSSRLSARAEFGHKSQRQLGFPRLPLSQGTRAARHVHDEHAHGSYFPPHRNLGDQNLPQELPNFNPKLHRTAHQMEDQKAQVENLKPRS
jgi:hypothetical protein